MTRPFFIFKHHYYFNATQYGLETPTWINVIRDPLTWFESNFYFKRFGWERQPGSRRREDQDLTIDECVKTNHEDCQRFISNITAHNTRLRSQKTKTHSDGFLQKLIIIAKKF